MGNSVLGRITAIVMMLFAVAGGLSSVQVISVAQAQSEVTVRSANHEGFSRAVFDFDSLVNYELSENDSGVTIAFYGDYSFNFLNLAQKDNFLSARFEKQGDMSVAILTIPAGTTVRHFRDFTRIVVDVVTGTVTKPESAPPATVTPSAATPADSKNDEKQIPADKAPILADKNITNAVKAQTPAVQQTAPQSNAAKAVPSNLPILPVTTIVQNGQQTLYFNWDIPVAAAVFKRSGSLWVVFDEPAKADLDPLQPYMNTIFKSATQEVGADRLVVRFEMIKDVNVKVDLRDNQWRVRLGGLDEGGGTPIVLTKQDTKTEGSRMFVPLQDPGAYLMVSDAAAGDVLDIVPVKASDLRVMIDRNFVQFQLLATAQGLVIKRNSDQIFISPYTNGVALSSTSQLFVSESRLDNRFASSVGDNFQPQKLIDFKQWKQGPLEKFTDNKHKLQKDLANADESERNLRRWDLARFYLAHGFAQEARAVMALMQDADAEIINDPKFKALLGVAEYRLLNFARAKELLASPELNAEPDVFLWRGVIDEALGNYAEATKFFESGHNHVDAYEDDVGGAFRMAHLRSVIEMGRYDNANWELARLRRMNLLDNQKAELDYLEGRLLEKLGEVDEAMAFYAAVDENKNRHAFALANYALTQAELTKGKVSVTEAIDRLERLRFAWRGDDFELNILTRLSNIYVEDKQYRQALLTMRGATMLAPESEQARSFGKMMMDIFRQLYLDGGSDEMPPVSALALYYDFRELTPLGNDGDQMIRRLSERLVSVDLLDQAADLLDHQVRFRLEGVPQAVIANRLAKIYLLANKPEKAEEILRMTRNTKVPSDVERERKLVDSRVLTELGRYEEAEVAINGLTGADVMLLRSDIYWGGQNWAKTTSIVEDILGGRWQSPEPMADSERQYLMRLVIAQSMLNDREAMRVIRNQYAEHMKAGRFATAFDLITSTEMRGGEEVRELVKVTASVNELKTFMDSYRAEFSNSGDPR